MATTTINVRGNPWIQWVHTGPAVIGFFFAHSRRFGVAFGGVAYPLTLVALSGLIAVPDRRRLAGIGAVGVSFIFLGAGAREAEGTMTVRMENQRL